MPVVAISGKDMAANAGENGEKIASYVMICSVFAASDSLLFAYDIRNFCSANEASQFYIMV